MHLNKVRKVEISYYFSSFLTDSKFCLKSPKNGFNNNFYHSKLAISISVCSNTKPLYSKVFTSTSIWETFVRSPGTGISFSIEQNFDISSLENFKRSLVLEGVSERPKKFMSVFRRLDTTVNYQSTWKLWICWCSKQNRYPNTCKFFIILIIPSKLFVKKVWIL